MTGLRWVVRLIGLVSISITARILTPEDFGIHSSAAIALGFFLVLRSIGISEFLIKENTIDEETINTGWTVSVLTAGVVTLLLLVSAPFAPSILRDERVTFVLAIIAFVPLADAFSSPRLMLLMREFRYGELFRLRVAEKAINFMSTVGLIYVFKSYWAIALGSLTGSIFFVFYTYVVFPGWPRPTLKRLRAVGSFAGVALIRSFAAFLAQLSDSLAARQIVESAQFGGYHNTKDLARNLIYESAAPIANVMLPTLSRLRDDRERIIRAITNCYGFMLYWIAYCCVGLLLLGEPVVRLILGEQWLFSIPYLQISGVIVGVQALEQLLGKALISLDRQPLLAKLTVCKAILAIVVAAYLATLGDPILLLFGALSVWTILNIAMVLAVAHSLKMGLSMFTLYIKPAIAAAAAYYGTNYLQNTLLLEGFHFALSAVLFGICATAIFAVTVVLTWVISGKRQGPELAVWELVMDRFILRQKNKETHQPTK